MLGNALDGRMSDLLAADDAVRASRFPGTAPGRPPVHTVCVAAERYHHGTVEEWGRAASESLEAYGPIPGFGEAEWDELEPLVHDKLGTEPIEDLRIDLTGGLNPRSDAEHVELVTAVARSLADSHADRSAPLSVGVRIPSLQPDTRNRAVETLDLLLSELLTAAGAHAGRLGEVSIPASFRVALPDVESVVQVVAMAEICAALEGEYGLASGLLRFEIEVGTPHLVVGADGTAGVAQMIHAAAGRCTGLQYRDAEFSAALGIVPPASGAQHASAEHAKRVLQFAAAGTGITVSDSAVELCRLADTAEAIRSSWRLHASAVQRALRRGILRGADVHPIQLASRYAATFSFYRRGLPSAIDRLNQCLEGAARPPEIFDSPATVRALAGFLLRGLDCGAFDESVLAQLSRPDARRLDRSMLEELASGARLSI